VDASHASQYGTNDFLFDEAGTSIGTVLLLSDIAGTDDVKYPSTLGVCTPLTALTGWAMSAGRQLIQLVTIPTIPLGDGIQTKQEKRNYK